MVSLLRRALGSALLETTCFGYVFTVDDDAVDASRFERLVIRARGEPVQHRIGLLEEALALWRGSPLVDVRYAEFAQGEIERLEELRVDALEELLAAKLALGACESVVPDLQRLIAGFPFRERLRMQLMLALHRSGLSVEALASYVDWHRSLKDSWCTEPGPAIRRLRDDIRLHAPGLEIAG